MIGARPDALYDPASGFNSLQMPLHLEARTLCASDPEHGGYANHQNAYKQYSRGDEECHRKHIHREPPFIVRIIFQILPL
jgi:hypothetical protein